ncbi:MAG: YfhO family protein [Clostridiales bacterium]|nr:YfhO family protein [Clostridiales bacterium]
MIEKTSLEKKRNSSIDLRPLFAFFLTFIAMTSVFAINQIIPFGARNVLTSDLGAQYGPYLLGLRQALTSGESLLYNRSLGLGGNTLGVFAYYLSSPLNFLVFFFPSKNLQELITLLIMLKLSFAGAFMTWLLDRKFQTKDKMTILFGMMYPLCSFAIVFMFNIMWLDGFAILPLLILLTEKIVEKKKAWPALTLVLFILFVSGYYMAYMVGIFSFIYLLSYMGYRGEFSNEKKKEGGKTVGFFILSAVTAALMSACILVPAGLNTLGNPDFTINDGGLSMNPEFSLVAFFDQLVEKRVGDLSNNLPLVFCGIPVLFLCILFFLNPKIKKNLKIAIAVAFGSGILCFHFPLFNRVWHLFDDPNWFNFRYSYLFSFVMILVAFYSYLHMEGATKKNFFTALGIVGGIAVISQSFGNMAKEDNSFFATILFAVLVCLLLYGKILPKWPDVIYNLKRLGPVFLVCVIVIEVVLFNPRCYMPDVFAGIEDAPEFAVMVEELGELSDKIEDQDWFRTEIHKPWHYLVDANNLPFYTGRESISIFASMANKQTNHFLKQLGYNSNYNYFSLLHMNSILPADSILGVRYYITTDHSVKELPYNTAVSEYYLYENPYAMPAAMLAKKGSLSFDGFALEKDEVKKDYFTFQENWISSLSGLPADDIYDTFTSEWEVFNGQKTDIPPEGNITRGDRLDNSLSQESKNKEAKDLIFYLRNNDKAPMVLRTTITAQKKGAIYFCVPYLYLQCVTDLYVNGLKIAETDSNSYYSQIYDLGYFNEGDEVKVELRVKEDVYGSFPPIFAYLDPTAIAPHTEALSEGVKNVTVKNGHYEIDVDASEDELLLITAPYEKGWKAYVDGKETEIIAYQDALLSVDPGAGSHHVELRFTPPGWNAGLVASGLGLLIFAAVTVMILRKKKNTTEKNDVIESNENEEREE